MLLDAILHSVLGPCQMMLQFLDLVAAWLHPASNIRLSYSMITAAVNQWREPVIKVQPLSFQITRWKLLQLKGGSGNSRRPLAPSMLTDGPPDTAESFILVQQIHSRGLQGPRALSSAVQGWSCGAAGGRSAGSESAMCLLQQLYSPRPTLCTTMHTGTSPKRNIPMM